MSSLWKSSQSTLGILLTSGNALTYEEGFGKKVLNPGKKVVDEWV
jgi:hypothetical protein